MSGEWRLPTPRGEFEAKSNRFFDELKTRLPKCLEMPRSKLGTCNDSMYHSSFQGDFSVKMLFLLP